MDACWYDTQANVLYMIELKDWTIADLSQTPYTEQRIWDLVKKSVDSVNMLASILLGKPHAVNFLPCIPFAINVNTTIKLMSIIHCNDQDQPLIASINQEYKTRFNSYAMLFDIRSFFVMTHNQAIARFDWIG